jgi:hypothetical protein
MTISPELMLAILSMDAYNREYGAERKGDATLYFTRKRCYPLILA